MAPPLRPQVRRALMLAAAIVLVVPTLLTAQDTTGAGSRTGAGQQTGTGDLQIPRLPPGVTPEQAKAILDARPDLQARLRQAIANSGLTPDQIRARLRAAGYPETLLDDYLQGADTSRRVTPNSNVLDAMRNLGVVNASETDSLRQLTDSARHIADSLRADSLSDRSKDLRLFGLDIFRRSTTQFQAALQGPVDDRYRLGPGDGLVLVLTGDVERAETLDITRDGFVVIPQVGQVYAASLTLGQFEDQLYSRLSRVYSGVRRGPGATTHFSVTVARLRQIQVFVAGDVARPGAYQISAAGTVLTALYAAGGPTERGTFRRVLINRGAQTVDSVDLYDYLQRGVLATDVHLTTGDVVFVPPRGGRVKVTGAVVRPAIYEIVRDETIADLIAGAGGFDAKALRSRVQIHRILAPTQRRSEGRDRVVIDVTSDRFVEGTGPAFPIEPSDSVVVFEIADRVRNVVRVKGNVWVEGEVGFTPGMKLSEAIRLAGGPKPDSYLSSILVSRLRSDSTRTQLRSALADSTGRVTDDLPLQEDDEIEIFSRSDFRPDRYVVVTGAVQKAGRVPYREGMTIRDALLQVGGVTEDAYLQEAEVARLPDARGPGEIAQTFRVPLDSTYLFDRGPRGEYVGPPGLQTQARGAPDVLLRAYDNVLILRQPEWELQRPVAIGGQVKFPGKYGLKSRTERLTDLLERAGGLTREAYPAGIEFYRNQGRQGRIGIDLPKVLDDPKFRDNLILVSGDSIVIPEFDPVVRVAGAVNAPVAVAFVPGKPANYYVQAAGGFTRKADKRRAYVTQPSGKVESGLGRKPAPGAQVFVPERDPSDRNNLLATLGTIGPLIGSLATVVIYALSR